MTKIATRPWRIAVVTSRFNQEVTSGLERGALTYLAEQGITVAASDIHAAPGAFEIPLLAQTLARASGVDGVVCLGCVIKGDTAHFEFISQGATIGLMQASLQTETPLTFGIITTYDEDQAIARSRDDIHNKGREAAAACLETLEMLHTIRGPKTQV
jgi:6,7-dimethyl-8-ribityllumazine synthase